MRGHDLTRSVPHELTNEGDAERSTKGTQADHDIRRKEGKNDQNETTEEVSEASGDASSQSKGRKRSTFKKPTVEEVKEYCRERGNAVDPEAFVDFYESKGWLVGKHPMKDWKAALRNWERRNEQGVGIGTGGYGNSRTDRSRLGRVEAPPGKYDDDGDYVDLSQFVDEHEEAEEEARRANAEAADAIYGDAERDDRTDVEHLF